MVNTFLPWLSRIVFRWPATHPSPPQIRKTFSELGAILNTLTNGENTIDEIVDLAYQAKGLSQMFYRKEGGGEEEVEAEGGECWALVDKEGH